MKVLKIKLVTRHSNNTLLMAPCGKEQGLRCKLTAILLPTLGETEMPLNLSE